MVISMATKKVTITLDEDHVAAIQKLVASHKAESVSGFIQHAVVVSLADVAGWGAMLGGLSFSSPPKKKSTMAGMPIDNPIAVTSFTVMVDDRR